ESDITFISEGDFYSNCLKIRKQGTLDQPQIIYSSKEFTAKPQVKHNKIFITTNDNAPNFKIMWTDISNPDYKNWKPFYDEKSDEIVDGCILTEQYVLVFYKKDIMRHCKVIDYSGKFVQDLNPPEFGDVAGGYYDKKTKKIYISLSTFVSQAKLYELSEDNLNNWKLIYQDKSPINTDNIESKLVFYKSKDGTNIPMFLCYRKDMALDGNNPTLLYGYGGFNISMGPSYLGTTASFINRGGVYAIACLRGGNEYGENWHRAGMLDKKQNGFDDFISAAEYLISEKYTNPQKLAIRGGSNGGLLIGAAVTQRPELFKAAVCGVPLLDMLRYHKFLIARYWIAEYGNAENEKDFKYIIRYSPYQNIKLGWNYPTMLVKAGENDARVDPLHAKKFVAALQNLPSQINPIMLYVDFESGHGSGQSTEQMIENIELEWQFIMGETGIR
ncbi:MAG TPA: prolyl oligopeptidase family serine peptidase, partial [Candidatus Kapabacteria bacterium]|nr:prolyl oligopeptidase family serine peptidase [Candidatus Kapabacteria bacterium]